MLGCMFGSPRLLEEDSDEREVHKRIPTGRNRQSFPFNC